ncbi:MAG: class I SAM-dependent methyltransferase [Alphaproteobacteria bacterium]
MTACILCGAAEIEVFLDLGGTALANKFLTADALTDAEPAFPLRVGLCYRCGHVQLADRVPPGAMFEDYLYMSSVSETLTAHLHGLARVVTERQGLTTADLVVDIGANDGTLLDGFRRLGTRVLGVDPARNLAPLAATRGVEVVTAFFGEATAQRILASHGPARAITMTNTFPHIPDLRDLLRGIDVLLAADGIFVIEAHYCLDMFAQGAFDTIYHEHVSYWALGPMMTLFDRYGFEVRRVEHLPIHHGQLRVFVGRRSGGGVDGTVETVLAAERAAGIPGIAACRAFADAAHGLRNQVRRFLAEQAAVGHVVGAYGAPAKGNTLLTFFGLGPAEVCWIADRSPLKQGRYTPGTHIPVVAPERILADMPDYLLLLAWNFADEILEQQNEYRKRGGRFVIPVPRVTIC